MGRHVSLLDRVRVASPCSVPWDAMKGDDRVRFCDACKLSVYNLSAMSREEAESLIRGREGRMCVSFYRRADGTMLTRDCPVGWRRARQRLARVVAGFAAACLTAVVWAGSLGWRGNAAQRLSAMQPFSRIYNWLSPPPPPLLRIAGDVCIVPALPIAPQMPGGTAAAQTESGASQ